MWLCVFIILNPQGLTFGDLLDIYFDPNVHFEDFYNYLKHHDCVFDIESYYEPGITDSQYDELRKSKLSFIYRCNIKDVW